MDTIKITIPMFSKPKPAGALGKHGNITMNKGGYTGYKNIVTGWIRNSTKSRLVVPYGVVIFHEVKSLRCGDLLNINGSVMDCIKKAELIKDDSPKNINRFYGAMTKGSKDQITIWLCFDCASFTSAISDLIYL